MPTKRIVPDHGLCPRCRGQHDRLLPVGAALDGTACAREYLVCDPCGTVWLNPSPRSLAKPPGPQETAENLVELSRLEEVIPAFEPVKVEVHEDRDTAPSEDAGRPDPDEGALMTCALTPADVESRGLEEPFEEAVGFLQRVLEQHASSEPSADGETLYLTLTTEPPA